MLDRDEYLKMIFDSPIPCMWIEVVNNEDKKAYDIKILEINKKLREISIEEIKEKNTYDLEIKNHKQFVSMIKNKENKIKIIDFCKNLGSFYEMDINRISDNRYVVWFTRKIELDKNVKALLGKLEAYLWCKDIRGRYVYINRGYDSYEKATPDNIVGKTDFEVFPEELATTFIKDDNRLLSGEIESFEALSFFNENYYEGINQVVKDDKGNIIGTIGICIDALTEKNNIISSNISHAKMLELISDTLPDSIFFKDKNGIFKHCNKVFAETRNLNKEDIIGKTEKDINILDSKVKKYELEDKEVIRTKKSNISVSSMLSKDGRKIYFETIKVPFLDRNQKVEGVLGISRDISHRKEAELEFERLRMEFFANLSHEFKTPLNLIFSSIQLIEFMIGREELSYKYRTYTNIIKQNGYRLLKMVNNLIDSTRLNSGCLHYNPQNYNIVEFIENICDSVQYYANEQDIELIFDTNLEENVMAFDLEKMERIILNLLSNAIKYNKEKGKIEVILNFEKDNLYIKVKDSGVGIPQDKLNDVFKLFKQVNNRMTKLSEGSGIGLSIVKSLVDLHNGTINVYSEEDEGSEFVIMIPVSICNEKEYGEKTPKYNKYVENIDIEFSDIYTSIKL